MHALSIFKKTKKKKKKKKKKKNLPAYDLACSTTGMGKFFS
jgi:hypothetical protein